jgi:hypothetical protein
VLRLGPRHARLVLAVLALGARGRTLPHSAGAAVGGALRAHKVPTAKLTATLIAPSGRAKAFCTVRATR